MCSERTETIETFIGCQFGPAPRSSGRSVGGEDHVHRAVESAYGEARSNRFAFSCVPIVNTPESSEVIEKNEEEDTSLAQATFSIVEHSNFPLPVAVQAIGQGHEILIKEQPEVGGEDGEGEGPSVHEE